MINKDLFIHEKDSIKTALKKLNHSGQKVLLVTDSKHNLLGTISDGDIRRCILRGEKLDSAIKKTYNAHPIFIKNTGNILETAKPIFVKYKIELLPVLDENGRIIDCVTWSQAFSEDSKFSKKATVGKLQYPVVIMAGGKGTRMEPFSRIFPKPLIPIGEKTVIEIIIDEFKQQGIYEYYISLNYKGEMIKSYFDNIEKDYKIHYVWEKDFLGTVGSVKLLEKKIRGPFIVSNCDVIVNADLREAMEMHNEQSADVTVLSSIQHYKIPYGVVETGKAGRVKDIIEKPEYSFMVNTGVYILNSDILKFIPANTQFDMTDLLKTLIKKRGKVITYLVNEKDYIDIGHWEEYKKSKEKLKFLG